MHRHSITVVTTIPFVLATAVTSADAAIKKIPYPEVKVNVEQHQGDDALAAMRKSFSDAALDRERHHQALEHAAVN